MKKEFLEIGKFVGPHGVRGMVRIQPWSDDFEFFDRFKNFYLQNGSTKINLTKKIEHGNIILAKVDGVDTIEQAEKLRNQLIYIKRDDADLPSGRYFICEIIGSRVFDADTDKLLGILKDVSPTAANDVWHIENGGKEYLVPAIADVIVDVDIQNDIIKIRPLKGIFEDED